MGYKGREIGVDEASQSVRQDAIDALARGEEDRKQRLGKEMDLIRAMEATALTDRGLDATGQ